MSLENSKYLSLLDSLSETSRALELANLDDQQWAGSIDVENLESTLYEIEKNYHPESAALPEKLWWIRCQLNLGLVPSSALTAPLEDIFEEVKTNSEYKELALATYIQAGLKLFRKSQLRLACLMLSRAYNLRTTQGRLKFEELEAVRGFYQEVLEQEQRDAELRRESKDYLAHLADELKACKEDILIQAPSDSSTEEKQQPSKNLSSKQILENIKEETSTPTSSEKVARNSKKRSQTLGLLALSIAFSVILAFAWVRIYQTEQTAEKQSPVQSVSKDKPKEDAPSNQAKAEPAKEDPLLLAKSEPVSSQSSAQMSQLDQRINNLGKQTREEPAGVDQNALQEAGKIKLPGEDDELVSIERENNGASIAKTNIPMANIPNLDRRKIQPVSVGSSPRKAPLMDPNPPNPQAAVLPQTKTPLRDSDPLRNRSGEKALDGSPLRSYEVETYNPPVTFRTITPTNVLVSPSLFSKSLTRLEVDTHVHVTRKMGNWLELRSTGGRTGYIFAQDATQLSLNSKSP
jgi:hypothetical protein